MWNNRHGREELRNTRQILFLQLSAVNFFFLEWKAVFTTSGLKAILSIFALTTGRQKAGERKESRGETKKGRGGEKKNKLKNNLLKTGILHPISVWTQPYAPSASDPWCRAGVTCHKLFEEEVGTHRIDFSKCQVWIPNLFVTSLANL